MRERLLLNFSRSILSDRVESEGKGCRRLFTLSDDAFGMHTGRPGERTCGTFVFSALPPFNPHGLLTLGGSYTRRRFRYARQRKEKRACENCFSFVLPLFTSHGLGGLGKGGPASLRSQVGRFGIHASGSGGCVTLTFHGGAYSMNARRPGARAN